MHDCRIPFEKIIKLFKWLLTREKLRRRRTASRPMFMMENAKLKDSARRLFLFIFWFSFSTCLFNKRWKSKLTWKMFFTVPRPKKIPLALHFISSHNLDVLWFSSEAFSRLGEDLASVSFVGAEWVHKDFEWVTETSEEHKRNDFIEEVDLELAFLFRVNPSRQFASLLNWRRDAQREKEISLHWIIFRVKSRVVFSVRFHKRRGLTLSPANQQRMARWKKTKKLPNERRWMRISGEKLCVDLPCKLTNF